MRECVPEVEPYGEVVEIWPAGQGAGWVSVVLVGVHSGEQDWPTGAPHGPYTTAPRGPMGVLQVWDVVRLMVPEVDPYGEVLASWPGGHGAGWVSVPLTGAHTGAHVSTGVYREMLKLAGPRGPMGVVHVCVCVTSWFCGQDDWYR